MNGFVAVALLACVAVSAAAPAPGHAFNAGYGFVAAGHGGLYAHSQPGVAAVNAHQDTHSYGYGLNEHGAHYTKSVHQSGHSVSVPVVHAVAHAAPVYAHHAHHAVAPVVAHHAPVYAHHAAPVYAHHAHQYAAAPVAAYGHHAHGYGHLY